MNNIKKYNRCQVFYHFAPCQLTGLDEVLLLSAFDPQCKFFSKRLNETCRLRKFRTTYFKRSMHFRGNLHYVISHFKRIVFY